ncbi:hypothetical protein MHO82_24975 [Vibrio sp. Of7-15]|uniref:hypothetical protein n=1 Tax=Vibrio sp. Of7-15 TaxID=2724879 RepID=UPI001EF1AA80|nr:hypothetical protein [Vibrio sp. Of7-15]MCG7500120.1 hypothetical protein [Vibrio sp. Of7-15]
MNIPTQYIYFEHRFTVNTSEFILFTSANVNYPILQDSNGDLFSPNLYFKPHPQELLTERDSQNFVDGYFADSFELESFKVAYEEDKIIITELHYLQLSTEEPTKIKDTTLAYGHGNDIYEQHTFDIIPMLQPIANPNYPPALSNSSTDNRFESTLRLYKRIEELK